MNAMTEAFPMIAGIVLGIVSASFVRSRIRIAIWTGATVAFGVLATWLSGEYRESWAFVLLDMLWVGGISYAIMLGVDAYRVRRSRK